MTDKEIIQALRLCGKIDSNCRECKLWGDDRCVEHLAGAAADIIERLTAENVALREGASLGKVKRSQKQAYEKQIKFLRALTDRQLSEIKKLQKNLCWKDLEVDATEAERDALREKVPQWISVEDRLPEDHLKRYLIAFKDAGGSIVDAARYIPGLGWECYNWDVPQNLITHWMPLPEAPEAPEEGNT